jgi:protease-4
MVFALLLLVLLGVSVVANLGWFFGGIFAMESGGRRDGEPRFEEMVLQDNGAHHKIVVVDLDGIISEMSGRGGFDMVEALKAQLKRAQKDDRVKAVLLRVNSPGGEVLASDEIYKAVSEFQEKSGKPVIAQMGSLAASGGYYVAVGARWIVANELTITGSIGVIMSSWNYRGLMDKVGIVPTVFKSGKYKDMLSGSREPEQVTPEEKKMVQDLIDEVFGRFKEVVGEGRGRAAKNNGRDGRKLVTDWREYADGRVFSGTEAFRLGFVDELGDFNTGVRRARKLAQIDDANLVQYQQVVELADIFGLFGQGAETKIKVDLGFDPPKLQAGKLYFISSTLIQ